MSKTNNTWIKFLGTAGARFVMIRQLRSSAGIWYQLNGFNLLVDPGPGTLVRCATSRPKLDPQTLDAILLSHIHLDHSNDINVMIEAMTNGGFNPKGILFAPQEALEGEKRVILPYLQTAVPQIHALKPGNEFPLVNDWLLRIPPFRHHHPVETYGYLLQSPTVTIGHITDTAFFPELIDGYRGVMVLIINVVRLKGENDRERGIQHLNLENARHIIGEIRPRKTVLTHFGMTMLKAKPWELAAQLSHDLGLPIIAANDGMTLDLEQI